MLLKTGGMNDLLICGEKIALYRTPYRYSGIRGGSDRWGRHECCPGCIDQHVHIIGGGGQTGYFSLAPEVPLSRLLACGTTTVVGLLGNRWFRENRHCMPKRKHCAWTVYPLICLPVTMACPLPH